MRTVTLLEATKAAFYKDLVYSIHNPQLSKQIKEQALVSLRSLEQNVLLEHSAFLEACYHEVCVLLFAATDEEIREMMPMIFVAPKQGDFLDKSLWPDLAKLV